MVIFAAVCQKEIAVVIFDAVKPPLATVNLATPTADALSGQRALSKPSGT